MRVCADNLYSITNQAAILALFRMVSRRVGNLQPMRGAFPHYPAPVIRNTKAGTEMLIRAEACHRRSGRRDTTRRQIDGSERWRLMSTLRILLISALLPANAANAQTRTESYILQERCGKRADEIFRAEYAVTIHPVIEAAPCATRPTSRHCW